MRGFEALLAIAARAGNLPARCDPLLATRIGPGIGTDPLPQKEPCDCHLGFLGSRERRTVQQTGSMAALPNGPPSGSMALGKRAVEVFRYAAGEIDPDPSRSCVDLRF